jgi:hypothetical protein
MFKGKWKSIIKQDSIAEIYQIAPYKKDFQILEAIWQKIHFPV